MPNTQELFPNSQDHLIVSLRYFADTVAADPELVGVSVADSVTLSALAAEFERAMQLISDSNTATPDNYARKDEVRDRALKAFRLAAGQIKANLNVSVEAKLNLGLKVSRDDITGRGTGTSRKKTRIEAPCTTPIIHYTFSLPVDGHHFVYADSANPDSRARPHGAARLDLHAAVHPVNDIVPDPALATFYLGGVTRSPFILAHDFDIAESVLQSIGNGKRLAATIFGRWVTRTELKGPWSQPVTVNVI